jgi:hypothetical protein
MKRIDLTKYTIPVQQRADDGTVKTVDLPYDVSTSIVEILFSREQQLSGLELLRRDDIARKVLKATADIILDEVEYAIVKKATELVKGLSRNDVELVRRIFNAQDYDPNESA